MAAGNQNGSSGSKSLRRLADEQTHDWLDELRLHSVSRIENMVNLMSSDLRLSAVSTVDCLFPLLAAVGFDLCIPAEDCLQIQ